ncbi:MAG: flavin reductase [Clostridia bacterium]|nr:flavin reductase [Clostridia bacterium]
MYCTRKVTDDLVWVGGNDRRLSVFEGVYKCPAGVSYNSYLLLDEKTVLMDTVDSSVSKVFFENLDHELAGRPLDYAVVQHMEPDHSATLAELLMRHPETTVVANAKLITMIKQYFDIDPRCLTVKEGDVLETGAHTLTFVMAPMVHWPEVMVTYDAKDGILFSADAFGTFGAINGAIFADEVDFARDYMDEARRYYCNIVGKYGPQVQALLKKAAGLKISMICPLHGFVWRTGIGDILDKYVKWSTYEPEEKAAVIAYASVYGNTANAAEILACRLREKGVPVYMYDVSMTTADYVIAAAFRASHLVFVSTTYNAGIFVKMEELLHDLAAHNIQNRRVAFIENGTWAATSGKLMRSIMENCKNMTFIDETVSLKSSVKPDKLADIEALAAKIAEDFAKPAAYSPAAAADAEAAVDPAAFNKLSYGLFVLTARDGDDLNGCIINTAQMLTDKPKRITIAVNKANLTHDMIMKTGVFNVSVLTESVPMATFEHFGFQTGRNVHKFLSFEDFDISKNGLPYITAHTNAFFSARVTAAADNGTHTLFTAEVTEAQTLSSEPSVTYAYYFAHIKPKKPAVPEAKAGFVCKTCGYVYEGDSLPEDFVCPICKHGPEDFERIVPAEPPKGHKWVCEICGYEYEGEELPADFVCPLCKHGAEDFKQVY